MQPVKLGARPWSYATAGLLVFMVGGARTCAQTVLGTPQETNDRIKSLAATARYIPHDYIIGSGDTISIDVFDVKELSRDVRVSQTGTIGLPLVPVRLQVKGLTETQAEQKIAEVLEANGLVSHPQVSVSVKERKSKPITVVGAVQHAMVYQADRPVTILEVLAEAGGIANDAGDTVIVTRPSQEPSADPSEPPTIGPEDPGSAKTPKESQGSGSALTESAARTGSASNISTAPKTVFPRPASTGSPEAVSNAPAPNEPPRLSNTITINLNELVESGTPRTTLFFRPAKSLPSHTQELPTFS